MPAPPSRIDEFSPVTLRPLHGLSQSQFVPQFSNLHYRVYNGTGTFDLGFANLTTSTSYETQKQRERVDFTFALSPLIQAIFGVPNEFIEAQDTDLKGWAGKTLPTLQDHLKQAQATAKKVKA